MSRMKPKCRVNWNKPYRAGTICNYVNEVTNECSQTDIERCPCGGNVRVPIFTVSVRTRCYRCGDHCEWDGPNKIYPRLLDFDGHPSCPSDAPMPKEFRDDGP
jgi:hypothetical protein